MLSLFTFITIFASGQDHNYKIKENKINKHATDLSLVLNPVITDISNDNTVAGYSADFLFRLNTIMSFRGSYLGSYYNIKPTQENSLDGGYNGVLKGDYIPFQYYQGQVTLYLYTDVYEANVKVNMPTEIRNGEKQHSYLELDKIDKMRQVGLRVGGGQYKGQLKEKGIEFHGIDLSNDDLSDINRIQDLDNSQNDNFTSLSYDLISAGVTYESVSHLVINVEDSVGIKSKKSQWVLYAEGLYGMNMQIGDLLTAEDDGAGTKHETLYSLGTFTEIAEFGYRVGLEHNMTSKVGWSYGVEIGARPGTGTFGQRSYISAKVGISFNFKTLKY
jgi:hypothetical protein